MANARGSRLYKRLVADCKERSRLAGATCARCGQPIDYNAPPTHPNSFQAGHIKSWSKHPESRHDPENFQAEHALCNQDAGNDDEKPGLGTTSEDW